LFRRPKITRTASALPLSLPAAAFFSPKPKQTRGGGVPPALLPSVHLPASFTSGEPPPPLPPEEATGILPSRPPFLLLQGWRRRRFSGL
jgi:hypothetical protein